MDKLFKIRYLLTSIILMITGGILQSCNNDEVYDVTGDSVSKVFINTQEWSPANRPANTYEFEIMQTPLGIFGAAEATFHINCTLPAEQDLTVTLALNDTYVKEFNEKYETSYATFAQGIVNLKENITIPAGKQESENTVVLSIEENKYAQLPLGEYLAVMEITSVSGSNAEINTEYNKVYMIVKVKEQDDLIKRNASIYTIGELISDYTDWTATADKNTSGGSYTQIFNGSTGTNSYWGFSGQPVTITIDMQQTRNLSALRLYGRSASGSAANRFAEVSVSTSEDGQSYDEWGTTTIDEMTTKSGYQYIVPYKAMDAQYVKLTLTWNNTQTFRLGLVEAYTE